MNISSNPKMYGHIPKGLATTALIAFASLTLPAAAAAIYPISGFYYDALVTGVDRSHNGSPDAAIIALLSELQGKYIFGKVSYLRDPPSSATALGGVAFNTDVDITVANNKPYKNGVFTFLGEAMHNGQVLVTEDCTYCAINMDTIDYTAQGSPLDPLRYLQGPLIPGLNNVFISDVYLALARADIHHNTPAYAGFPDETPGLEDLKPVSQFDVSASIIVNFQNKLTGGKGGFYARLVDIQGAPEPAAALLMLVGLVAVYLGRRFKRRTLRA